MLTLASLSIPFAQASVYVPTTTYFYINGTWKHFVTDHTFTNVTRINGVWYFDGETFNNVLENLAEPDSPIITGSSDLLLIYLIDGNLVGFILACYTSRLGMAFYGILLLLFSGIFYNRTKSMAYLSIMWLILGGAFIGLTWVFSPIAVILVVFGLVGIIYSLIEKESY